MPVPRQQTTTSPTQAKPTNGDSAQAETGGYWRILWHTPSPGEELLRAVAQDMEEPGLETSTPVVPRRHPAPLTSSASVIRAVRQVETGVTALGQ